MQQCTGWRAGLRNAAAVLAPPATDDLAPLAIALIAKRERHESGFDPSCRVASLYTIEERTRYSYWTADACTIAAAISGRKNSSCAQRAASRDPPSRVDHRSVGRARVPVQMVRHSFSKQFNPRP